MLLSRFLTTKELCTIICSAQNRLHFHLFNVSYEAYLFYSIHDQELEQPNHYQQINLKNDASEEEHRMIKSIREFLSTTFKINFLPNCFISLDRNLLVMDAH